MREAKNVQRPRIRTLRAFEPLWQATRPCRRSVENQPKTQLTGGRGVRSERYHSRCNHSRANVRRLASCTPRTSNDVSRPRRWCREGGCYVVVNAEPPLFTCSRFRLDTRVFSLRYIYYRLEDYDIFVSTRFLLLKE